ncbi:MAG: hypothetical protein KY467_09825 [Gemmatimonadetes bacterium]|nr:hypothetical protein [Gemmatimonadota bacterium]
MYRILVVAAALALPLSACGEREPTPQQQQARHEARLDACIAEALSVNAHRRLAMLDSLLAQSQARGSVPSLVSAPHKFAQVYATYADLRAHETAYRDSAYSATSKEDSTRFEAMAASFRVNRPSPESLEENVVRDYLRDFASSRRNPEHGCNHLLRKAEKEGE